MKNWAILSLDHCKCVNDIKTSRLRGLIINSIEVVDIALDFNMKGNESFGVVTITMTSTNGRKSQSPLWFKVHL